MPQHIYGDGGDDAPGGTAYHEFTTVTAGTRTRLSVAEISEGRMFVGTRLSVATVQDPGADLEVALFSGQEQVTPVRSKAVMATDELDLPASTLYDTGDEITVELDARNRSSDIDVTVIVAGVLAGDGPAGLEEP
jgi:hypothetical protein